MAHLVLAGSGKSPVGLYEALHHRDNQPARLRRWHALLLREDLAIFLEVAEQRSRQFKGDLDRLVFSDRSEFLLGHAQPPYGSRTRSRVTITRTGKPGRIVSVGAMLSCRRTISDRKSTRLNS